MRRQFANVGHQVVFGAWGLSQFYVDAVHEAGWASMRADLGGLSLPLPSRPGYRAAASWSALTALRPKLLDDAAYYDLDLAQCSLDLRIQAAADELATLDVRASAATGAQMTQEMLATLAECPPAYDAHFRAMREYLPHLYS